MGIFDIFGQSRRSINRQNQEQGREGERMVRAKYEFAGYKVQRTGRGHDFKITKRDPFTGKTTKPEYHEVKTGNSPLSPLQKKKKRQMGKRYVVDRVHTPTESLRPTSSRKKSSDGWFGGWGAPKAAKSKRSSDDMFGRGGPSGDLFGSTKSRKRRKSRKSNDNWF